MRARNFLSAKESARSGDLGRRRGDPVGSDVDVTLTVETVVHLGQALTLRENPYCCFVVIVNSTNTVFP